MAEHQTTQHLVYLNGEEVPVNIALIGCGQIAPAHADAFAQLPDVRMVAAVNRTLAKAERLATIYHIPDCYSDYRAVLARDDVDAVAILTSNESHREIAEAAAAAGKHILLEKPMALSLEESQTIIDAAERHDVKLMIGQTARYHPVNLALKTAIDAGEVGQPAYLHVVWNHGMFWGGWRAWQIQREHSGGHIIHNGVHALDLAAWLLGQPIESVYTQTHRVSSPHLEADEDFRVIVRCRGGAIALCEISYALPSRGSHLRTIEVIGDQGRASHSTLDDGLLFHSSGVEFIGPVAGDSMVHQNRDFVRYLREGGPSPVSGADGQRALAAALAAQCSAEEGRPVRIDELLATQEERPGSESQTVWQALRPEEPPGLEGSERVFKFGLGNRKESISQSPILRLGSAQVSNLQSRIKGVCLLSCVRHQRNYAPLIAEHPDLRIVCVADEPNVPEWVRTVNQEFAGRYNVPYLPIDQALARSDVNLVSICSEPARHARLAVQAARAGVHVLVDKPMATTAEGALQVAEAVQQSGVTLTYVHHLFNPALEQARQLIDSGRLSVPWAFHIDLITGGGLESGFVEDFSMVVNPALSGGGEIMNFLNYAVGYLRFLTGLEVESVYAVAGTYFFEPHHRFGVEDLGIVALNLERGVTATVSVGRIPAKIGPVPGSFTIRGQGTYGLFLLDQFHPRVTVEKVAGEPTASYSPPAARHTGIAALLDDLVQAIRHDIEPRCGPSDGVAIARVVDAVYRSLASGEQKQV